MCEQESQKPMTACSVPCLSWRKNKISTGKGGCGASHVSPTLPFWEWLLSKKSENSVNQSCPWRQWLRKWSWSMFVHSFFSAFLCSFIPSINICWAIAYQVHNVSLDLFVFSIFILLVYSLVFVSSTHFYCLINFLYVCLFWICYFLTSLGVWPDLFSLP